MKKYLIAIAAALLVVWTWLETLERHRQAVPLVPSAPAEASEVWRLPWEMRR